MILKIDDEVVRTQNDLYRSLDRREVGAMVRLTLLRGDQTVEVMVTLQSVPNAVP